MHACVNQTQNFEPNDLIAVLKRYEKKTEKKYKLQASPFDLQYEKCCLIRRKSFIKFHTERKQDSWTI